MLFFFKYICLITFLPEQTGKEPTWNFWKYIIDHNGKVLHAYGPKVSVLDLYNQLYNLVKKTPERKHDSTKKTVDADDAEVEEEDDDDNGEDIYEDDDTRDELWCSFVDGKCLNIFKRSSNIFWCMHVRNIHETETGRELT